MPYSGSIQKYPCDVQAILEQSLCIVQAVTMQFSSSTQASFTQYSSTNYAVFRRHSSSIYTVFRQYSAVSRVKPKIRRERETFVKETGSRIFCLPPPPRHPLPYSPHPPAQWMNLIQQYFRCSLLFRRDVAMGLHYSQLYSFIHYHWHSL
jgi:hypothetical protein